MSASEFTSAGAWAPEFADAMVDASPYEAEVLGDGVITAAERSAVQARKRACMRDAGYDYRDFDDGTAELQRIDGRDLPDNEEVERVRRACTDRFDRNVSFLYNEIRRNPEKRDEAEIAAACLRASGLVGKGYSERKWRSEYDTGVFAFNEWDARAVQCRLDPLGLWRDG